MRTPDKPIVLVGMMASGKSRLGRELARVLGLPFIDMDKQIENEAGMTIAEIFAAHGEQDFRDREAVKIHTVLNGAPEPCVISTGGGVILRPASADLIFGQTVSIWTRATLQTLLTRTARRNDRPLLKRADPAAVLQAMAAARGPIYARATLTVDTDSGNVPEIVAEMIEKMGI